MYWCQNILSCSISFKLRQQQKISYAKSKMTEKYELILCSDNGILNLKNQKMHQKWSNIKNN